MTQMIEVKTADLTGRALDYAVAMSEGATNLRFDTVSCWWFTLNGMDRVLSNGWSEKRNYCPSTDWRYGGPLIDGLNGFELKVWTQSRPDLKCEAHIHNLDGDWIAFGHTPLIAAMRCLVASKLGGTVEVPKELLP